MKISLFLFAALGLTASVSFAAQPAKTICVISESQYSSGGTEGDDQGGQCLDKVAVLQIVTLTAAGDETTATLDLRVISINSEDYQCILDLDLQSSAEAALLSEARQLAAEGRCEVIQNQLR